MILHYIPRLHTSMTSHPKKQKTKDSLCSKGYVECMKKFEFDQNDTGIDEIFCTTSKIQMLSVLSSIACMSLFTVSYVQAYGVKNEK